MFFLLSFSNLQKSSRTSFWNQNIQKDIQNPPEMDPRGPQKQHFPGFLEFFISMPLSTRIAVFACPCASSSFQDAAKKHLGTDCRQKRSRHCSFATFSRKCPKTGSRQGSWGGSANHLFASFLFRSCLLRGLPGGPGSPKCSPRVPKRCPGTAKTKRRGCQNAPGCAIGRITF